MEKRGCCKQGKVSWLPLFPDPWGGDTTASPSCCHSLRPLRLPQLPCDGITPSTMRQNKSSHRKEETAQDTQLHVVLHPVGCTVALCLSVLLAKTLDCILLHFSSSSCVPIPQRGGRRDADTNFSHQRSQGDCNGSQPSVLPPGLWFAVQIDWVGIQFHLLLRLHSVGEDASLKSWSHKRSKTCCGLLDSQCEWFWLLPKPLCYYRGGKNLMVFPFLQKMKNFPSTM